VLASPSILTTLVAFLLLLGPLVLFHELGHYLVGRWFGVKADIFSIGFGRELVGWSDRRGTRWKISALPLGGYVQFAGDMNAASMPGEAAQGLTEAERREQFHFKPLWQRALIVLAGPLTNLLLAAAIFSVFNFAYGKSVGEPVIADFLDDSPAEAAGLRIGDRIVAIDGKRVAAITDLPDRIIPYAGETLSFAVLRGERELVLPVKLNRREVEDQFGNKSVVGDPGINFALPVIGRVLPGSPAAAAGLKPEDRIVAVDGHEVKSFDKVAELIRSSPGKRVSIGLLREGERLALPVEVATVMSVGSDGQNKPMGQIGVEASFGKSVAVGPLEAVKLSIEQCASIMRMTATGLGQILTGKRSARELGGPIKIAQYSGQQYSLGWEDFVWFVAMISINLAFINLLPIPALDGGHLVLYAAEAVRRRPLGMRSQEWAFRAGLALVLALMLFVTINDLASLPVFGG